MSIFEFRITKDKIELKPLESLDYMCLAPGFDLEIIRCVKSCGEAILMVVENDIKK